MKVESTLRTWAEIDLSAMLHNFMAARHHLPDEVLLAAGVGAGAVPRWNGNERNIRLQWTGRMIWNLKERKETDDGTEF